METLIIQIIVAMIVCEIHWQIRKLIARKRGGRS